MACASLATVAASSAAASSDSSVAIPLQPDATSLAPLAREEAEAASMEMHWSVDKLNALFRHGTPSNNMSQAGLLIHNFDDTGYQHDALPWIPCAEAACRYGRDWSASIVSRAIPALYGGTAPAGLILSPSFARVKCSYYLDMHSDQFGCGHRPPEMMPWDPLGDAGRISKQPYPANQTADMLVLSERIQEQGGDTWNEVVVDASRYTRRLPGSLAAFYTRKNADGWTQLKTKSRYCQFLSQYSVGPRHVPLLSLDVHSDPALTQQKVWCDDPGLPEPDPVEPPSESPHQPQPPQHQPSPQQQQQQAWPEQQAPAEWRGDDGREQAPQWPENRPQQPQAGQAEEHASAPGNDGGIDKPLPSCKIIRDKTGQVCAGDFLTKGESDGLEDCQARCKNMQDGNSNECKFASFWFTGGLNWCKLSATCDEPETQEHTVSIYWCGAASEKPNLNWPKQQKPPPPQPQKQQQQQQQQQQRQQQQQQDEEFPLPPSGSGQDLEFLHIPKNAGTAIEETGEEIGYKWGYPRFNPYGTHVLDKKLGCSLQHVPRGFMIANPTDSPLAGPDPYKGARTFCVVRHPFTRAISQYIYWSVINEGGCWDFNIDTCSKEAFDQVCKPEKLNAYIDERFNPSSGRFVRALRQIRSLAGPVGAELRASAGEDCHWLPQWMHVGDRGSDMCDHVLRYEKLGADLDKLVAQYPNNTKLAKLPKRLEKVNTAAGCSLRVADLDASSRKHLAAAFDRDFKRFRYSTTLRQSAAEPAVCPMCGLDSGKPNCCKPGGTWEGKCSDSPSNADEHTWQDGFDACAHLSPAGEAMLWLHEDHRVGLDETEANDVRRHLSRLRRPMPRRQPAPSPTPTSAVAGVAGTFVP